MHAWFVVQVHRHRMIVVIIPNFPMNSELGSL